MDTRKKPPAVSTSIWLQWSHDLSAMDTRTAASPAPSKSASFNGAMTFQPWIPGPPQPGIHRPAARFNGAMTFQPWIPYRRALSPRQRTCFNGAMTFQPWIRSAGPRSSRRRSCFNGAMTFQPWIRFTGESISLVMSLLQWSHDLSAMDTTPANCVCR